MLGDKFAHLDYSIHSCLTIDTMYLNLHSTLHTNRFAHLIDNGVRGIGHKINHEVLAAFRTQDPDVQR
jgi:hypothetical protein